MKSSSIVIYANDGLKGFRQVSTAGLSELKKIYKQIWVHLNLSDKKAYTWLQQQKSLSTFVKSKLSDTNLIDVRFHRPLKDFFLILRSFFDQQEDMDSLFFLTAYVSENLLLTAEFKKVLNLNEINHLLSEDNPPKYIGDFISIILEQTLDNIVDTIVQIEEKVDKIEDSLIKGSFPANIYETLSELLRQVLNIRRFIFPERNVLDNLNRHGVLWFSPETEQSFRDNFLRICRIVDDIDAIEKRIRINQDALNHMEDRKNQRNTYILSVIAGIFLPLTFLTGIFGMNLGGIPLSEHKTGFLFITLSICFIGFFIWYLFKKWRWF